MTNVAVFSRVRTMERTVYHQGLDTSPQRFLIYLSVYLFMFILPL